MNFVTLSQVEQILKRIGTNTKVGIVIALYYRHLSTDIKKKNYKIKTSFVNP